MERAGVELPNPDKEVGNKNNRKMTFDREMREKLFEICEHYGVQITREPIKDAEHDMSKNKLLVKKNAHLKAENRELKIRYKTLKKDVDDKQTELDNIDSQIEEKKQIIRNFDDLQRKVAMEIIRRENRGKQDAYEIDNFIDNGLIDDKEAEI